MDMHIKLPWVLHLQMIRLWGEIMACFYYFFLVFCAPVVEE